MLTSGEKFSNSWYMVCVVQLISAAFEHSTLRAVYALENAMFYIAVYGAYKL